MKLEGGCYCGKLRYVAEGEPMAKGQCHCRECQHISGGSPNVFFAMPAAGFKYVKGEPKTLTRTDIQNPATRQFCAECGTHIASFRSGPIILKVGTLDDPGVFGRPQFAVYVAEKQSFHQLPDGVRTFEGSYVRD
jgi:hypothetical protein